MGRKKKEVKDLDVPPVPPEEIKEKEEEPKKKGEISTEEMIHKTYDPKIVGESQEETKVEKPRAGIRQKLEKIEEALDILTDKGKIDKSKKKKLLGWKIKSQLKSLALKSKVFVIFLRTNRAIDVLTSEIKDGFIVVKDKIYDATTAFVYLWKGKYPCIVVKEWDLEPVGTKDYYEAIEKGQKVDAETVIIRAIEAKEQINQKKLSSKAIIWLLIGAVALFYILFAGGGNN